MIGAICQAPKNDDKEQVKSIDSKIEDEKLLSVYKNYLSSDIEVYKPAGEVKVSNEMGYISSVESARKNLEDIFNDNKES